MCDLCEAKIENAEIEGAKLSRLSRQGNGMVHRLLLDVCTECFIRIIENSPAGEKIIAAEAGPSLAGMPPGRPP
jgi:hypothetical protein